MAQTAREIALLALSACEKQGAWSDGYLKRALHDAALDIRDAALATKLCFGVLQNKLLLDFYINAFSSVKSEAMENRVLNAIRIGAYQLLFLTRIPPSAAVNESVKLTRKWSRNPRAAGLVNGVLRTLARNAGQLPQPKTGSPVSDAAIRTSHPEWLVQEWFSDLGEEEAVALLEADNTEVPTTVQLNTCRTDTDTAIKVLSADGVAPQRHPWLPDCLLLTGTGSLEQMAAFRKGLFYVQDAAARLAVLAAGPARGMRVLDACAAPGGKSFAAAVMMEDMGEVISCDIHPHKERLIRTGAERLGLDCITPLIQDGKTARPEWVDQFDLVIADVPCSGLGIIRKKPDIRYKDPAPLDRLPAVQSEILENVSRYVRPGGVLLYATCTIRARENRAVVQHFLEGHNWFEPESFTLPGPIGGVEDGTLTLYPHRHGTDGFYIAKLRRRI